MIGRQMIVLLFCSMDGFLLSLKAASHPLFEDSNILEINPLMHKVFQKGADLAVFSACRRGLRLFLGKPRTVFLDFETVKFAVAEVFRNRMTRSPSSKRV